MGKTRVKLKRKQQPNRHNNGGRKPAHKKKTGAVPETQQARQARRDTDFNADPTAATKLGISLHAVSAALASHEADTDDAAQTAAPVIQVIRPPSMAPVPAPASAPVVVAAAEAATEAADAPVLDELADLPFPRRVLAAATRAVLALGLPSAEERMDAALTWLTQRAEAEEQQDQCDGQVGDSAAKLGDDADPSVDDADADDDDDDDNDDDDDDDGHDTTDDDDDGDTGDAPAPAVATPAQRGWADALQRLGFPAEECVAAATGAASEQHALWALLRRYQDPDGVLADAEDAGDDQDDDQAPAEEFRAMELEQLRDEFTEPGALHVTETCWTLQVSVAGVNRPAELYVHHPPASRYPYTPPLLRVAAPWASPGVRLRMLTLLAREAASLLPSPCVSMLVMCMQQHMPGLLAADAPSLPPPPPPPQAQPQGKAKRKRPNRNRRKRNIERAAEHRELSEKEKRAAAFRQQAEAEARAADNAARRGGRGGGRGGSGRGGRRGGRGGGQSSSGAIASVGASTTSSGAIASAEAEVTVVRNDFAQRYNTSNGCQDDDDDDVAIVKFKRPSTRAQGSSDVPVSRPLRWDPGLNARLADAFAVQQQSSKYVQMEKRRCGLPARDKREDVLQAVRSSQVVVISGETGCGKTTQVPQFILDDMLQQKRGSVANVICTQPRRLAAIAVAERVAEERGEAIGQSVGYSIRMESKRSRNTRLLFCTTGILLRTLLCDADLSHVSHVILDEVHEREQNSDFLLILLRRLLKRRPKLRLVLMSATLNSDLFAEYFGGAPTIHIPGRTFPVAQLFLEDALQVTGHIVEPGSPYALREARGGGGGGRKAGQQDLAMQMQQASMQTAEQRAIAAVRRQLLNPEQYSAATVRSLARMDQDRINFDLLADLVRWIAATKPPGAVLVFLPGMAEIETLVKMLRADRDLGNRKRALVLPLHSMLGTGEQHMIFDRPPAGVRKIVVSTNIAETSLTIDDVVYVVDSGKVKEKRYDSKRKLSRLEERWVSRANARQRAGRAGRVQPGECYRLFTRGRFDNQFADFQVPEMLRVPLEELVLQLHVLDMPSAPDERPEALLREAVEPPSDRAIDQAVATLQELCALDADGDLTALGWHLAALPLDVRIGRFLVYACMMEMPDPALTLAAALSIGRNVFSAPYERRRDADEARKSFAVSNSDQFTLLSVYQHWLTAKQHGDERQVCRANFLSIPVLRQISDLKTHFARMLVDIGFLPSALNPRRRAPFPEPITRPGGRVICPPYYEIGGAALNANAENLALLAGVLCAGLFPNVVRIERPRTGRRTPATAVASTPPDWRSDDGRVSIHPSSVAFGATAFSSDFLLFQEKLSTSKVWITDVTSVSQGGLLMFGGALRMEYQPGGMTNIHVGSSFISFTTGNRAARDVVKLRRLVDRVLEEKITNPGEDMQAAGHRLLAYLAPVVGS